MIAHVLLPLPIDHGFDFLVPKELETEVTVGRRVEVKLKGKKVTGIIVSLGDKAEYTGPLEKIEKVFPTPMYSVAALRFVLETSWACLAPPGIGVNRILPEKSTKSMTETMFSLRKDLGSTLAEIERLDSRAPRQAAILRHLLAFGQPTSKKELRKHLGAIDRPLSRLIELGLVKEVSAERTRSEPNEPSSHTRSSNWVTVIPKSGKVLLFTRDRAEGYVRLLREHLPAHGAALILAPEIIAAQELYGYLSHHLGEKIGLYHSGIAEGTRGRTWEEVRSGKLRIVVGTRSAVFLPFDKLPLVIVEYEEDRSYKQDEMLPYYHARNLAEKRGKLVILASPAPAVETYYSATQGDLTIVHPRDELSKPIARTLDMRKKREIVSQELTRAIGDALHTGEKVIIVVPRRGYFQAVICKTCGRTLRCPNCGANLIYDVKRTQLICRVCGRVYPKLTCPHCGGKTLRFLGAGVERVEAEIKEKFPTKITVRIDGESVRKKPNLNPSVAFEQGAHIIVGTPVIAKGMPLLNVGLAAVIGIDSILAAPDFRAAERTYQLIVNLGARLPTGKLFVQTCLPDHYAIRTAITGDYNAFLREELETREMFSYPPFSHLARILITSKVGTRRQSETEKLMRLLERFEIEVLGPSPHPRRRGTDLILLKANDPQTLREACLTAREAVSEIEIDLNPDRI